MASRMFLHYDALDCPVCKAAMRDVDIYELPFRCTICRAPVVTRLPDAPEPKLLVGEVGTMRRYKVTVTQTITRTWTKVFDALGTDAAEELAEDDAVMAARHGDIHAFTDNDWESDDFEDESSDCDVASVEDVTDELDEAGVEFGPGRDDPGGRS